MYAHVTLAIMLILPRHRLIVPECVRACARAGDG